MKERKRDERDAKHGVSTARASPFVSTSTNPTKEKKLSAAMCVRKRAKPSVVVGLLLLTWSRQVRLPRLLARLAPMRGEVIEH